MSIQSEVFRLARRGQVHPDSEVAEAAYIWAREFSGPGTVVRIVGWTVASVVLFFIVGDVGADYTISRWFGARKVLSLGPPSKRDV